MQLIKYHKGSVSKIADLPAESRGITFCQSRRSIMVARSASIDSISLDGKSPEEWVSSDRLSGINALVSHGEYIFFERDNKVDGAVVSANKEIIERNGRRADQVLHAMRTSKAAVDRFGGLSVAPDGSVAFACAARNRVLMFNSNSVVTTLLGNGQEGFSIAIDPVTCLLRQPCGVLLTMDRIYVADTGNHCIRVLGRNGLPISIIGHPQKTQLLSQPKDILMFGGGIIVADGAEIKIIKEQELPALLWKNNSEIKAITSDGATLYFTCE